MVLEKCEQKINFALIIFAFLIETNNIFFMKKIQQLLLVILCASLSFFIACEQGNGSAAGNSDGGGSAESLSVDGYDLTPYAHDVGLQKAIKKQADKITEEGDLRNGKKVGTWVTYHTRNGLIASITSYNSSGVQHGLMVKSDDRGNITEKAFYINGVLEGKKMVYNRTRVKEESEYVNGKLDGTRKLYYDNGKLQEEGSFKAGQRDGVTTWYDQEENPKFAYEYENGKKVADVPIEKKEETSVE